jgi:ABC-2 type transport system ATP-binding protein
VAIVKDGKIVNVEEIPSLRKKQLKKVHLLLHVDKNIADYGLDGIGSVESGTGKILTFLYSGDINILIDKLSVLQIDNLSIEEPSLEEIFLHY